MVVHVHHDGPCPAEFGKLDDRQADRARADDEKVLARLRIAAIDRVTADGQRFHERELFEGQFP